MVSEEENPPPEADSSPIETSADDAEKTGPADSDPDFEAHGSWGGIG